MLMDKFPSGLLKAFNVTFLHFCNVKVASLNEIWEISEFSPKNRKVFEKEHFSV